MKRIIFTIVMVMVFSISNSHHYLIQAQPSVANSNNVSDYLFTPNSYKLTEIVKNRNTDRDDEFYTLIIMSVVVGLVIIIFTRRKKK